MSQGSSGRPAKPSSSASSAAALAARGVRQLAQEIQHLGHAARHAVGERVLGVGGKPEQLRRLVTQTQDVLDDRGVVEAAGARPLVGGARAPRFVEHAPQGRRLGIGDHRHVGGLLEPEHPAIEPLRPGALCRRRDDAGVEPGQLRGVGEVMRPAVGGIEHLLLEFRLQQRQLAHDGLEARLGLRRQRHAGEAEIAQCAFQHRELHRVQLRALVVADILVGVIERFALRQVGVILRQQRQAGVVGGAQRLGIHHGIEMSDRRPGARQAMAQLLERHHHGREARPLERGDARQARTALVEQRSDRRLDMLRADPREVRQHGVGQQWIGRRGGRQRGNGHPARLPEPGRNGNDRAARQACAKVDDMATDYDLIVIGGGSGGLACAQRAADHGARALVIESHRLGGTCVNVGCVPKKVMWNAAQLAHAAAAAHDYGFELTLHRHDWALLKRKRDAYVERLNGIYAGNLERRGVQLLRAHAQLGAAQCVVADGREYRAPHIVLATGGHAVAPSIPGAALGITSDGFFELPERPARVAIVGSGYVAVELAGVFAGLGSKVTMVLRGEHLLRHFEPFLGEQLRTLMAEEGVEVVTQAAPAALARDCGWRAAARTRGRPPARGIRLRGVGRRPHRRRCRPRPRAAARGARRRRLRAHRCVPGHQRPRPVRHRRCDRPRAADAGR